MDRRTIRSQARKKLKQTLTIFTLAYNLEKIRYPWRACIASALHFADEVLVAECFSTDGTYEGLLEIQAANPKLRIIRHPWGQDCTIQRTLAEMLSAEARSDWIFYLNADEVLHESSVFALDKMAKDGVNYGMAHYTHFLGNFHTTFPFIYDRVTRLMHGKIAAWSDDACGLAYTGSPLHLNVEVQHFGKVSVGREVECGIKEREFQQLYTAYGFPDMPLMEIIEKHGKLDYSHFHKMRWAASGEPDLSGPFTGTHSCFVKGWIEEMERRHEVSRVGIPS